MDQLTKLTDALGIFVRLLKCPVKLGQYCGAEDYIICNVKITLEDFTVSDWEYFSFNTTIDKIPSKKAYYKCKIALKPEVSAKLNNKKFLEVISTSDKAIEVKTTEVSVQLRDTVVGSGQHSWNRELKTLSDRERKKRLEDVKKQAKAAWSKEKDERVKSYIDNYIWHFNDDIYNNNLELITEALDVCLNSKKQKENFILLKPIFEDFRNRWANRSFSEFSFSDLTTLHKESTVEDNVYGNCADTFDKLKERFAESIIFQKLIDIIEKETSNAKSCGKSADTTGAGQRT